MSREVHELQLLNYQLMVQLEGKVSTQLQDYDAGKAQHQSSTEDLGKRASSTATV